MTLSPSEKFMRLALQACAKGVEQGQSPFGACIVKGDRVVAIEHNRVWQTTDITAHAEVTALRSACLDLNTIDLSGCIIYSTTEPCPMCFSAIHWANCDGIVFGASISDAASAGFRELAISNQTMKQQGGSRLEIVGGFLRDEAMELFQLFSSRKGRIY